MYFFIYIYKKEICILYKQYIYASFLKNYFSNEGYYLEEKDF